MQWGGQGEGFPVIPTDFHCEVVLQAIALAPEQYPSALHARLPHSESEPFISWPLWPEALASPQKHRSHEPCRARPPAEDLAAVIPRLGLHVSP